MRHRLEHGLPKSNNSVEGFHNALRYSITSTHPNLWKLLLDLKTEIGLSEKTFIDRERGDEPGRKKKYRKLDQRINNQLVRFDSDKGDVLLLLKNLANMIEF